MVEHGLGIYGNIALIVDFFCDKWIFYFSIFYPTVRKFMILSFVRVHNVYRSGNRNWNDFHEKSRCITDVSIWCLECLRKRMPRTACDCQNFIKRTVNRPIVRRYENNFSDISTCTKLIIRFLLLEHWWQAIDGYEIR